MDFRDDKRLVSGRSGSMLVTNTNGDVKRQLTPEP